MSLHVFDQLSVGVVLLDHSARIVFANDAAQSLSQDGSPLRLHAHVTSHCAEHARRLGDLIRSALAGTATRTMSLPAAGGGRLLMIMVSPVHGADMSRLDVRRLQAAAAMMLICDPDRPSHIPAGWITEAYGLTVAEVRVALAIAAGTTIPNTARRLNVSANTVKTHLRHVYDKTGTNSQAALSRLMATISLARGGSALIADATTP